MAQSYRSPTNDDISALISELFMPFYQIERQIDAPTTPNRRENDAEHSWSTAVLATALAARIDPSLDPGLVCQLAVAHDLMEVYAGDTSIFAAESEHSTKRQREQAGVHQVRSRFSSFPWLAEMAQAVLDLESPEARFVTAVDKLIALHYDHLTQLKYLNGMGYDYSHYLKSLNRPMVKAHRHPDIGRYYDQLLAQIRAEHEAG